MKVFILIYRVCTLVLVYYDLSETYEKRCCIHALTINIPHNFSQLNRITVSGESQFALILYLINKFVNIISIDEHSCK